MSQICPKRAKFYRQENRLSIQKLPEGSPAYTHIFVKYESFLVYPGKCPKCAKNSQKWSKSYQTKMAKNGVNPDQKYMKSELKIRFLANIDKLQHFLEKPIFEPIPLYFCIHIQHLQDPLLAASFSIHFSCHETSPEHQDFGHLDTRPLSYCSFLIYRCRVTDLNYHECWHKVSKLLQFSYLQM